MPILGSMKQTAKGDLLALLCAVSTGLGIIPAKAVVAVIAPETLVFYLFVFAFIISLFPLGVKGQREIIGAVRKEQLLLIIRLAVLYSAAIFFSWTALVHLEPATQSFLSRIKVFITVLLAIVILKEKLYRAEIIGALLAVAGIVLLKFKAGSAVSSGITLMLISALLFSSAEIMLKAKIKDIHPTLFLFFRNLLMIPCFAVIIWMRGVSFALPDLRVAGLIALTSLLAPVIGRTTYIMAIKRNSLSRTVLINQTQPMFAALAGFVILHSLPTPIEWLSGGLILAGAFIIGAGGRNTE